MPNNSSSKTKIMSNLATGRSRVSNSSYVDRFLIFRKCNIPDKPRSRDFSQHFLKFHITAESEPKDKIYYCIKYLNVTISPCHDALNCKFKNVIFGLRIQSFANIFTIGSTPAHNLDPDRFIILMKSKFQFVFSPSKLF